MCWPLILCTWRGKFACSLHKHIRNAVDSPLCMAFHCGQKYDNQIKKVQNHFPVRNYKLHTEFWKIAIELLLNQKYKLKVEFIFIFMNRVDKKISREEAEVSCWVEKKMQVERKRKWRWNRKRWVIYGTLNLSRAREYMESSLRENPTVAHNCHGKANRSRQKQITHSKSKSTQCDIFTQQNTPI